MKEPQQELKLSLTCNRLDPLPYYYYRSKAENKMYQPRRTEKKIHQHDCHFVETNCFSKFMIIGTQMSQQLNNSLNSKRSAPID